MSKKHTLPPIFHSMPSVYQIMHKRVRNLEPKFKVGDEVIGTRGWRNGKIVDVNQADDGTYFYGVKVTDLFWEDELIKRPQSKNKTIEG